MPKLLSSTGPLEQKPATEEGDLDVAGSNVGATSGSMSGTNQGFLELLQQQLEAQADVLRAQTRSFELQKALLMSLTSAGGAPHRAEAEFEIVAEKPACAASSSSATHCNSSSDNPELFPDELGRQTSPDHEVKVPRLGTEPEDEDFYAQAVENHAPWKTGPEKSSWLRAGLVEMFKSPLDLCLMYDQLPHFIHVALVSLPPHRFKTFLLSSLDQVLLFLVLVLSILFPAVVESETPTTMVGAMANMLTAVANMATIVAILQTMLLYKLCGMISDTNFIGWITANRHSMLCVSVLTGLVGWLVGIIVVLTVYDRNVTANFSEIGIHPYVVLLAAPVSLFMFYPLLVMANVAARSAVYSGALADTKVPVPSLIHSGVPDVARSFFGSALGGQRRGFAAMMQYYAEARKLNEAADAREHGVSQI